MNRNRNKQLFIVGLLIVLLAGALPAHADGLLFLNGVYRQPSKSHIDVLIRDKVATTTLEQTFVNPLGKQVSATYIAPVPSGASVTGFAEQIDGQWIDGTIKSSAAAQEQFNAAAAQGQDAAISSASASMPPGMDLKTTFHTTLVLPANAQRSVRLTYTEVLSGVAGLTRYTYPLSNTNLSDEPIGELQVDVKIAEKDEVRAVYSPSHKIDVTRADTLNADALYNAKNVVPTQDFELVYSQSSDKFGLNLVSYRDPAAKGDADATDGYFMLIAAPQLDAQKSEVVQKDFVFVLDRSGSMQGQKFDQAKTALLKMIDSLNAGDRFALVAFDDQVMPYSTQLQTLDDRANAKKWVAGLEVGGGTNINDALLKAFGTVDLTSQRPHIIVFLTDGQPTEGVTSIPAILHNARKAIPAQSRIYTVGVGTDVNQPLLDSLAQENRGSTLLVTSTEQLEAQLGKFYAAIGNPVLVDLALDFGGMDVYDVYPKPLPDMFLGGQVVVTGRYRSSGAARITLNGKINGQPHAETYQNIQFLGAKDDAYQYVPRLWAQRKIDTLVRQLEVDGPSAAAVEQVKALGLRYNLVTPYTSFVVSAPKPPNAVSTPGLSNGQAKLVGQPGVPNTGLPFLYADDFRTVNTGLLIVGAALAVIGLCGMAIKARRTQ